MGLALSVGAIVLVDLCLLGFGPSEQQIAKRLAPWIWVGFGVMLITGAALFFSNVSRYVHNSGFLAKMGLLLVALLAHFTVHRKGSRFAAILSLVLWSCVVVSSKFIADLDL
jgi:uncharacterized membrane protein YdcZ (DUF606 family)